MGERRFSFEKAATLHDPERAGWQPVEPALDALALRPGDHLLDLGSGTGYFAIPAAERVKPAGGVVALDVEPRMHEVLDLRARSVAKIIATVTGDLDHPPWPVVAGSVTAALLANLYHELEHPAAVLAELRRVLAPRVGRVLIVDWDPDAPGAKGPPRDHRVGVAAARAALAAAGFIDVEPLALYKDLWAVRART